MDSYGQGGYDLYFKTRELKKKWLEQFEMALWVMGLPYHLNINWIFLGKFASDLATPDTTNLDFKNSEFMLDLLASNAGGYAHLYRFIIVITAFGEILHLIADSLL